MRIDGLHTRFCGSLGLWMDDWIDGSELFGWRLIVCDWVDRWMMNCLGRVLIVCAWIDGWMDDELVSTEFDSVVKLGRRSQTVTAAADVMMHSDGLRLVGMNGIDRKIVLVCAWMVGR